jgi:acyl-CoA thioester hydrolase
MYRAFETYRGFVYPTALDHLGHMNVQSYTARFDEATWHFLARLGLTPSYIRDSRHAAVAADQRTQYRREVLVGSLLHVTTELLQVGHKSVRFMHRMFDSETDTEVATTELAGVYFDLERRVSVPLPAFVYERAALLEAATVAF